jgi:GNAT superfamily N-acetyltransferase
LFHKPTKAGRYKFMNYLVTDEIPDLNLFMMCRELDKSALSELSGSFHTRCCRKDELDIWKAMPFDNQEEAAEYRGFMDDFFATVYERKEELFFETCLFVCDADDRPVATGFIWKAYDAISSYNWFKVLKGYEGKGIGRALLSITMQELNDDDYPVYLHTQPGSYRAIKLYSDFGFSLISDPVIGARKNHLEECLPILEKYMPSEDYQKLRICNAPGDFMQLMETVEHDEL